MPICEPARDLPLLHRRYRCGCPWNAHVDMCPGKTMPSFHQSHDDSVVGLTESQRAYVQSLYPLDLAVWRRWCNHTVPWRRLR